MVSIAAVIMWILRPERGGNIPADQVHFNHVIAFFIALIIGFVSGIAGAPGAYMVIP